MIPELINILKSRELRISCEEDAILMILEIKLQSISLSANYVERTKFRKINNTIK